MKININDIKYLVTESVKRIISEQQNAETPSIYVGTYGKYNNGSLEGEWVDLTQFDSKEDFLNYCYNTLHANEKDAELMFQDYEYIPDIFIGESYIDERFWDFMRNNNEYSYDVKCAVADHVSDVDEYFNVIDDIAVYRGCDDMTDVAYAALEDGTISNPEYYFDYADFGRDCSFDGPSDDAYDSIYEEYGVDEDDDAALGEEIVNSVYGGVENLDKKVLLNYVNLKELGQAIESEGTWISSNDGMIEIR